MKTLANKTQNGNLIINHNNKYFFYCTPDFSQMLKIADKDEWEWSISEWSIYVTHYEIDVTIELLLLVNVVKKIIDEKEEKRLEDEKEARRLEEEKRKKVVIDYNLIFNDRHRSYMGNHNTPFKIRGVQYENLKDRHIDMLIDIVNGKKFQKKLLIKFFANHSNKENFKKCKEELIETLTSMKSEEVNRKKVLLEERNKKYDIEKEKKEKIEREIKERTLPTFKYNFSMYINAQYMISNKYSDNHLSYYFEEEDDYFRAIKKTKNSDIADIENSKYFLNLLQENTFYFKNIEDEMEWNEKGERLIKALSLRANYKSKKYKIINC